MAGELDLAREVVAFALDAGATQAEATYAIADRFSTEARGREVSKLEQSVARGVTLRVFDRGAKATLATSDLSRDGLRAFVRETVAAARLLEPDAAGGLPDAGTFAIEAPELPIYAADVRERAAEAKGDDALALERIVRETDERISNSSGSRVADSTTTIALANSFGFGGTYRASQAVASSTPIARDGETKRQGAYGAAARSYAALESIDGIARTAARRAVASIGARKPATMRCPVVFDRDVASLVLSDLFAAASAANVAAGNSFLAERAGERIGSDLVTIVDDGRLPHGLGTAPFDAEGVATRRTVVFERGTFRSFLYDTYYARRLGAASTGNAAGGGIGPTNFYLEPGEATPADLIAATSRGIFVTDTIGFSTESVTGTYSRGARGFAIENGELGSPVDEFTIAGNLLEMLASLDRVANDLVFDQSIVSPTIRIAEMTVSGR
ncbi:MAG: TldD/PmbA family protein [Candidatus Eremiobacteraeota bacterium]|nr:TldD/PmbA family protein [Candidatus Eremiobacteraeota bacterium]